MIDVNLDGFRIFENGSWGSFLVWETSRESACRDYLKCHPEFGIHVNPFLGFTGRDLSFLEQCNDVRGLTVLGDAKWNGINSAIRLEALGLDENRNETINLSQFHRLKQCAITWTKNVHGLPACIGLEELVLTQYKSKSLNLIELSDLANLTYLHLLKSNISSLEGVEAFSGLGKLELTMMRNLRSIKDVTPLCGGVTEVVLDGCNGVDDIASLGQLQLLRTLKLLRCGKISSLSFISSLKNLEILSFAGTEVEDGDLHFLEGIKHVGFDDRKGYSHTLEQLRASAGKDPRKP